MTKKHPLLPSEFCENHDNCINPLCVERRDKLTAELNQQEEEIDDIKKQLAKFKAFYFAYREIILNMCNDEEEAECIKSLQGLE